MCEKPVITLITTSDELRTAFKDAYAEVFTIEFHNSIGSLESELKRSPSKYQMIISDAEPEAVGGIPLKNTLKSSPEHTHIPLILLVAQITNEKKIECLKGSIDDIFEKPLNFNNLQIRIERLIERLAKTNDTPAAIREYKIPVSKRLFDIVFSILALIILSPLIFVCAIIIWSTTKSSPFIKCVRVGMGSKSFGSWQFRTMYQGAEEYLKGLTVYNYCTKDLEKREDPEILMKRCPECEEMDIPCSKPLWLDKGWICQKLYQKKRKKVPGITLDHPAFTPIGRYLLKNGLENLPQLWNVLTGNISVIGNHPLTFKEFRELTTNQEAMRFIAPAGIISLCLVQRRLNNALTEQECRMLDIEYASRFEGKGLFWFDFKLLLKWFISLTIRKKRVEST